MLETLKDLNARQQRARHYLYPKEILKGRDSKESYCYNTCLSKMLLFVNRNMSVCAF